MKPDNTKSSPTEIKWRNPLRWCDGDYYICNKPRDHTRIDPAIKEKLATILRWPLFLFGFPGTGKTCAALCMADTGRSAVYRRVPDMLDELIRMSKGDLKKDDAVWWTTWESVGIVILDELGSREQVSDFHYENVLKAIDSREDKPAIFISNLPIHKLVNIYDARIASRLAAGTVIEFTGPDRRLQRCVKI